MWKFANALKPVLRERMSLRVFRPFLLAVLALGVMAGPVAASKKLDKQRDKIREMRDEVLAELYEVKPGSKARLRKAEGYAVFSNVGVNVIFASVAGGRGIVVDEDGKETFMKMASAGLGIGLGVKDFRAVFVFYDEDKLENFIEKGWDFSAQADAAAKSDDKGGQAALAENLGADVEVYQFTKNGLALQATLQGTKYWRDPALNDD